MNLPALTDMVTATEYVFTPDDENRLAASTGREKKSRWYLAQTGTPGPGPETHEHVFVRPWPGAWTQLNDPVTDAMVAVCIMARTDPGHGMIVLIDPTPAARDEWTSARLDGNPRSLGVETATHCTPPAADYRAVFPSCHALMMVSGRTLRWSYATAPGRNGFEVASANYLPPSLRTRPDIRPPAGEIAGRL